MKAFHFILVIGLAGFLLAGCTTAHAPAHPGTAAGKSPAGAGPMQFVNGNPDAFAHFAAGESYFDNDDADNTLQQWDAAALDDPQNERLVIEVAEQLLQHKQQDKALALLTKSASRPGASAVILASLARVQVQTKHPKQALESAKRAIQRDPGLLDGYDCEIEILLQQKAWTEAARTLHRAAREIRPEPGSLLALTDLYIAYLKDQPKDEEAEADAVAALDRAAETKSASSRLSELLADHYARLNQEKKAAAIYNKLLDHAPDPSTLRNDMHEKLAGLYIQDNDRTNAMEELKALIRENPTAFPRAWFVLGELDYENGDLADAVEAFSNALHGDHRLEQAYYDLSLAQLDLHQEKEAFETLDQARDLFSKTFACEFYTGVAYAHVKKFSEAIRHFKEAEVIGLATGPSKLDQRFYFQFGAACERAREYKQAEEYLQKCVTLQPDFAEAMNYLGYMFADLGQQLPRARALIEKAISLDPRNGAYLDSLGWVLFKQHEPRQALPQLLKAIQYTTPPDSTVFDHLGEVYVALHQTNLAVEAWKKSYAIEANDDVKRKIDQYSGGTR
jgi:tetratricopeptide (TPR) repeat protein